ELEGAYGALENVDKLAGVVMVDQSPIGKSSRSNPVSYVGAWDAIRALFAALPEAKQRGYTGATFSFNSGQGRCPHCNGSGFEHVEMQFLSDVWLRCEDCDGRRYRPEVLELQWSGLSVADVLDLTVHEALTRFAAQPKVLSGLAPLAAVGLDYLRLGQPVPTLSGGEAQRLKLAGHLASVKPATARVKRDPASKAVDKAGSKAVEQSGSGQLFLFDEPTTGLHFEDIARLIQAFDQLLAAGHSVIVIEHNLDLIAAADWIIDLGPEGGEGGGEVVASGSPAQVMQDARSHTAAALREHALALEGVAAWTASAAATQPAAPMLAEALPGLEAIEVRHAREHNLQDVSVSIPRDAFTVVTGLSGSGKSTLAFDIIYGEGQRRYLESLNAYARQFVQPAQRADVDGVFGIPPTVAIEQRTSRGGRKSTVATLTEIHPFLRLLYVKLGTQYCPSCDIAVEPQSPAAILARIQHHLRGQSVEILAPLVVHRKGLYTDLAKWARGKGHAQLRVDGEYLPTAKWPRLDRYREHSIELPLGMVVVKPEHEARLRELISAALEIGKGVIKVLELGREGAALQTFSTLRACPDCGTSFPEPDPRQFSYHARHGWCEQCYGTGLKTVKRIADPDALDLGEADELVDDSTPCPACQGARLNAVSRAVRFRAQGIHVLTSQSVDEGKVFFDQLKLDGREHEIGRDLISEIRSRLAFLQHVGLGYLALDRAAPTLSGGEAQRIRLAAQLGSNLRGVCYVLDEPTIGLHPRDNQLLLDTLQALRAHGNTLLVVEHDEETIRRADHIIDLGPGAGVRGGEVVAEGDLAAVLAAPRSLTGQYLRTPLQHPLRPARAVAADHPALQVLGASLHNLREIDVRLPLARLNVVTGVSGSGKSTLARDVIHRNLRQWLGDPALARKRRREETLEVSAPLGCRAIEGWQQIGRVLEVDQTPIGKTPRSCPATYVGFWDAIRRLFADTFTARTRGWGAARFSFNTGDGRCPQCNGAGQTTVEMNFLPDVRMPCEACSGARFNADTLNVRWKEKNIAEVLAMSIDDAVEFFAAHPAIAHPLQLLQDVGLGYLSLGQPSPTLSGGEAQRIKLVTELAKVKPRAGDASDTAGVPLPAERHTLYVLDEPTVGLHMADVAKLITVLHRLADSGHTVLVIEHDLDVIAEADWLIDLGPEGGSGGGELLAAGALDCTLNNPASHTGRFLAEFLAARTAQR
ncbi:MAG: excinuclease ABC subunit A, partial [Thauera sp.]|nr:excinuclease ABC subunit A [Thauera sp.]